MNIDKRLSELEDIAERANKDYETGAWTIFEEMDGSRRLSSARLGTYHFKDEQQMQEFIDQHHKGTPDSWGDLAFIRVGTPEGEPPKEL